jgi:hypothetical protein
MAASFRPGRIRFGFVWKNGLARVLAALTLFAAGLAANAALGGGFWGAGVLVVGFAAAAYGRLLDADEKAYLVGLLRNRRAAAPDGVAGTEGRG